MNPREREILLLTCQLGDPQRQVLTLSQLRNLLRIGGNGALPRSARQWRALGCNANTAERFSALLDQQEQLDWYIHEGKNRGCVPIVRGSEGYPRRLMDRLAWDTPASLWAKGDLSLLSMPCVALVGSRELALDNAVFAAEAGKQAALQGYALVSGNARGADRTAQESCLRYGGKVICVVPDRLESCPWNENVLYLSENGFDLSFSAHRALDRNRVIHSLAPITLVAQCAAGKGGTWDGTVKNLRHCWSPVFCFRDGSEGIAALCDMGADYITIEDLADLSLLRPLASGMLPD